ncbi:MAG: hypothetical protein V4592_04830 [Bacteroidota bacterium]
MIKRVKAFTIMEITVAMLIAAIVIAITYTCYTIVYKSYLAFKTRQHDLVEVSQLTQLIERDMEKGDLIVQREDGITIKGSNNEISYAIQPDYILRIAAVTDTFKVKTEGLIRYFEGQALATKNDSDEQNRIDELSFTILLGNDKFPYDYLKPYSSQNLINRNPNAIN